MAEISALRKLLQEPAGFISDMYAPNMLYAQTLRSSTAHARVTGIALPELPSDVTLLTATDVPRINRLSVYGESMPLLAGKEVHYVGEPIGVLVGPHSEQLRWILSRIDVSYQELPAYFIPDDAMSDRVVYERTREWGNVEAALNEAYQVVEGRYHTGAQEHLYSEPQGAFALREEDTGFLVFSSTQWPYHVQQTVSEALGIPRASCRVRATDPGVHLDGKLWYPSLIAAHAAIACSVTGRPVKMVLSREEDFLFTSKRAPAFVEHTTGLDRTGNLSALNIRIVLNMGAYPLFTQEMADRVALAAVGEYQCQNVRVDVRAVTSNLPPLNVCSGFGAAQAFFALETHVSRITEVAQVAPVTWKKSNLKASGNRGTGAKSGEVPESSAVLDAVSTESDFARKYAAYELQKKRRERFSEMLEPTRGIGIACCSQGSGFLQRGEARDNPAVVVRLDKDGSAEILTSAVAYSDSVRSLWKKNVNDILGIEEDRVTISEIDTSRVPDSGPSTLSRNVTVVNRMIESCCKTIKTRRFRTALPIEVKRTARIPRDKKWNSQTMEGEPFQSVSHAAAVVEVEVNPVTVSPAVRGIWLAVEAGRIMNPTEARKTAEMGIYHALGWSSTEGVTFTAGALSRSDYQRYQPQLFTRIPTLWIEFVKNAEKLSAKGLGDLPLSCIPAAYAAAVTQATGEYLDQIPATPRLLRAYMEET